jgi:hypothetical protein
MALSVFDDKSKPPNEPALADALGRGFALWNELKEKLESKFDSLTFEWGFSSKTTGWGMRVKQKERVILYMTPCRGYFLASFALGEKAVKAAHDGRLPAAVLTTIDSARRYAEGRGVRFEVKNSRDVSNMTKVSLIKAAN